MPRIIHFEKARQKIRDNKPHRYNAYSAFVDFVYQKKYKINSELNKIEIKFNFTTPKKDWSIYGGWVNPFEPINKGRLGSTQEWRIEKPKRYYY